MCEYCNPKDSKSILDSGNEANEVNYAVFIEPNAKISMVKYGGDGTWIAKCIDFNSINFCPMCGIRLQS